jgi:membrane-bound lytic murein transglycosylase MltF
MSSFLHTSGTFKSVINDTIIDDINWNAQYDGVNLDVIANNKNNQVFLKLDNNDIEELLNLQAHPQSLKNNLNNEMFQPIYLENKHSTVNKKKRCKKGTRRNKKSGLCESKIKSRSPTPYHVTSSKTRKTKTKTPDILKTIY